jgi:CheY-like chemotaxis protein
MAAERILVVDDDELNREYVEEVLLQEGYEVVTAADAFEALDILKKETLTFPLCNFAHISRGFLRYTS